jgi:demethylmenaquinone methyltransferase/2-methoxy-6-polyprenyl-1,4-benzoquinol methylase
MTLSSPHNPDPDDLANFGYRRVPPRDKPGLVQDHFSAIAKRYDLANTVLSFGRQHAWKRKAVAMMGLKPGDRVLDLCGGSGDLALRAADRVGPSGKVVIYDFNRDMINAGAEKIAASPQKDRVVGVQGDAQCIAAPEACFDAVMVGFGIRNLTYPEVGFSEMYRVLTPGGTMMCLEFGRPAAAWFRFLYDFYSFHIMPRIGGLLVGSREAYTYLPESIRVFPGPDQLAALLADIGFEGVHYRLMTGGIVMIHVGRKPVHEST